MKALNLYENKMELRNFKRRGISLKKLNVNLGYKVSKNFQEIIMVLWIMTKCGLAVDY